MLVLSRKTKEQIMIGDDVRITLLRIDGNKVRIGIDAPKEVRVVRGELTMGEARSSSELDSDTHGQISEREEAFAHPPKPHKATGRPKAKERLPKLAVGTVKTESASGRRAPLSGYMTAS